VAGLALGWAWFALCAMAFGGRLLRFGAPVEAAERVEAASEAAEEAEDAAERPTAPSEAGPAGGRPTRLERRDQRELVGRHPEPGASHEHTHRETPPLVAPVGREHGGPRPRRGDGT
jgi:hypothetical protein